MLHINFLRLRLIAARASRTLSQMQRAWHHPSLTLHHHHRPRVLFQDPLGRATEYPRTRPAHPQRKIALGTHLVDSPAPPGTQKQCRWYGPLLFVRHLVRMVLAPFVGPDRVPISWFARFRCVVPDHPNAWPAPGSLAGQKLPNGEPATNSLVPPGIDVDPASHRPFSSCGPHMPTQTAAEYCLCRRGKVPAAPGLSICQPAFAARNAATLAIRSQAHSHLNPHRLATWDCPTHTPVPV